MSRYARQICLPDIGAAGQQRLGAARVLVIGAGGLGCSVLPLLAGAGIGHLCVFDADVVEESNLHRQTLYRMSDIGQPKALVAAESLRSLNPDCRITARVARFDAALARAMIPHFDVVIDAADSLVLTYMLSDVCAQTETPLISASVLVRQGYVGGFCGTGPSYRSLFPDLPNALGGCASGGVMGPVVAMFGAIQAQMCLAVLLHHTPSPIGQLMSMDFAHGRLSTFRFDDAPEPDKLVPVVVSHDEINPEADMVLDLRSTHECAVLPFVFAKRVHALEVLDLVPREGQRVVFVCASGVRAWRAAQALSERFDGSVAILLASQ